MGCINSKSKCVICSKSAKKVLWPCGHYCLCEKCCIELSKYFPSTHNEIIDTRHHNTVQCPLCRTIALPCNLYS